MIDRQDFNVKARRPDIDTQLNVQYCRGMVPKSMFGRTGHESSRIIFGAMAFFQVEQSVADRVMERVVGAGINHIDTASIYGDSELRLTPFLKHHRDDVFLATKTHERSYQGARDSIRRSLERLGTDRVDLIQFHHLVNEAEWEEALGDDGALRAAIEARDEGLVSFIGVTGHGTRAPKMHMRSLERFDFDSVLLPYNFSMMQDPVYAADFNGLIEHCHDKGVAVQTIKAIARGRRPKGAKPNPTTWYEPLQDRESIERAVHWALGRDGIFVNSSSELTVLEHTLAAGHNFDTVPSPSEMEEQARALGIEPLFIRGFKPSS